MTNNIEATPEKKIFALKLIPPRPSFAFDMNDEEKMIMQQHVAYWTDLMAKGIAIIFGPVLDPNGVYGFGVVAAENEEQVKSITENDPATRVNKYEYYPMLAVLPQS